MAASWSHGDANWGQDAQIGIIGRLGRPAKVSFCDDLVEPSLNVWTLILPLIPCIVVSLAVTFGLLLFPEGMVKTTGQKTAKRARLCVVARTVCRISPTMPEKQ